jgi:hypothetical protein
MSDPRSKIQDEGTRSKFTNTSNSVQKLVFRLSFTFYCRLGRRKKEDRPYCRQSGNVYDLRSSFSSSWNNWRAETGDWRLNKSVSHFQTRDTREQRIKDNNAQRTTHKNHGMSTRVERRETRNEKRETRGPRSRITYHLSLATCCGKWT